MHTGNVLRKAAYRYVAVFVAAIFALIPANVNAGNIAIAENDFPAAYGASIYRDALGSFESLMRKNGKFFAFRTYQNAGRKDFLNFATAIGGDIAITGIKEEDYYKPINLVEALTLSFRVFKIPHKTDRNPWYKDVLTKGEQDNHIPAGVTSPVQLLTKAQTIAVLVSVKNEKENTSRQLAANVFGALSFAYTLPVYAISVDPKDIDALFSDNSSEKFDGTFVQDDGKSYEVKIDRRGQRTRNMPKKSFDIKFQGKGNVFKHSPLFPEDDVFDGSKIIALNAEFPDQSMLRNHLAYKLFRSMNKDNLAPHVYYAHLYINNKYYGIYAATEHVDEYFLTRNDRKVEGALLYKFKEVQAGFQDHPMMQSKPADFFEDVMEKKIPGDDDHEEIITFISKLNEKEGEDFMEYVTGKANMSSIVDWLTVIAISAYDDGLAHNFYLYKNPKSGRFEFIPWDYDLAFGNTSAGTPPVMPWNIEDRIVGRNRLLEKLWKFPEFRERVYASIADKFALYTLHPLRIRQHIENIDKKLSRDMHFEEKRWQKDNGIHKVEQARILEVVQAQFNYLNRQRN